MNIFFPILIPRQVPLTSFLATINKSYLILESSLKQLGADHMVKLFFVMTPSERETNQCCQIKINSMS